MSVHADLPEVLMRSLRFATGAILVALATTVVLAQKPLVIIATITDPTGAEVTDVDPMDVAFTENGTNGTVLKVEPVAAVVPKIQLLVDNGVGMPSASLGDLRTALKGLINALPTTVEITFVTTAPQPRMLEKATTDHVKLLSAVDRLAPDSGGGKFVDSLYEATDRINKDKQEGASYTIIAVATTSGDLNFRESDVKSIQQRIQQRRSNVQVVLLNGMNSGSIGGIQTDLGKALADMTGGRFEVINTPNRLITLLPEIGTSVGKAMGPGAKQFRLTLQRPNGASGNLGQVGLGVAGKILTNPTLAAGQ
jgi:hypothetical protein